VLSATVNEAQTTGVRERGSACAYRAGHRGDRVNVCMSICTRNVCAGSQRYDAGASGSRSLLWRVEIDPVSRDSHLGDPAR